MTQIEPIRTADGYEVVAQLYIQNGRTLYKVSTVYPTYITAIVCLDNGQLTPRTRVRTLSDSLTGQLTSASDRIVNRYHALLDGEEA